MSIIRSLYAVGLYLIIVFALMQNAIWLSIICVVLFTWRYGALAFIPLAVVLDGYYGAFYQVPLFSIGAVCFYVFSEIIRARINVVQS